MVLSGSRSATQRGRGPRRPATALAAVLAAVAMLTSGCTDGSEEGPPMPDDYFYIVQGTQFTREDMSIGLASVSDGTAALHVNADDMDEMEVMRVGEGETVEAGHRSITVHRVDEGSDEGVALTIEGMEPPSADGGEETDTPEADPMDDPEVFAAPMGQRRTEEGITFAHGGEANGIARILVSAEGHDDEEIEVQAGDEVEVAGRTVLVVDLDSRAAYLTFVD